MTPQPAQEAAGATLIGGEGDSKVEITIWMAVTEAGVGHKVDLTQGGERSVCGLDMLTARPYHGDKFCKKCLTKVEG